MVALAIFCKNMELPLSFISQLLSCEQREGKERGGGKSEPVGMAKDFLFQMPVTSVLFKSTVQVASTTTTNLESISQL